MISDGLVTLVVCGAPLASRTPELVGALSGKGWRVSVVGTPASAAWLDPEAIARQTGEPPRLGFHPPSRPGHPGTPDALVVCPATFNTINKAATGVNDSYALDVLCEALGTGVPVVAVPMVDDRLWRHPAWAGSLNVLRGAGVLLVDVVSGGLVPTPVAAGTGDRVVAGFDPAWLIAPLARLTSAG
ncbi:flavoprotein [Rugosimonospora africana]|uniref:flavoprotein n=1 Tax=Rugosimonospora africana TaxID=556532 RepID=UPI001942FEAC|nr:flavoprotein [Rugosimonospora africana]